MLYGEKRWFNKKFLKVSDIQMQFQKKYELTSLKTRETIISGNGKYESYANSYIKANLHFLASLAVKYCHLYKF